MIKISHVSNLKGSLNLLFCPEQFQGDGTNLEFMSSESLKGRITYQKSANT